jgi:hypothetical protein
MLNQKVKSMNAAHHAYQTFAQVVEPMTELAGFDSGIEATSICMNTGPTNESRRF